MKSILVLMLAAGCAERVAPTDAATRRDSAGILIVEHTARSWTAGAEWSIAAEPTLQIGEESGAPEYLFSGIAGAVRLADGSVAVANGSSGEIRIYDLAGRHRSTAGGRGDGPGEFRRLAWLAATTGDSLPAFDADHRRLSRFAADGTFSGSVPLGGGATGAAQAVGLFSDGSVVAAEPMPAGSLQTGLVALPLAYVRYDAAGLAMDTIAIVPGPEQFTRMSEGMLSVTTPPFGRFPLAAARGDRAFTSTNDVFQIEIFERDGRLRTLIRREGAPEPVTRERIEEVIAAVPDENARAAYRAAVAELPRGRTMPVFAEFMADATGRLWVREYGRHEDSVVWRIVSQSGSPPAFIRLPGDFRPTDAGANYLLGVWTNSQAVEHVRMYSLQRPSR